MKQTLSRCFDLFIKGGMVCIYLFFILSVLGSWVMNWWGDKLLADKLALNALLVLAIVTFYEVTLLKRWGQKNLSDLIKIADTASKACDDLAAKGGYIEIDGKAWRS